MTSLKAFCEDLAPLLGLTPAALYERQRALVRMGDLPEPVQGRGKGLHATPATVAILLVAVMETDSLSDTDLRVHRVAKARYRFAQDRAGGRCELTGKVLFVDALTEILGSQRLAGQVARITVHRSQFHAQIFFWPELDDIELQTEPRPHRNPHVCQFGRGSDFPRQMEVAATLWSSVVVRVGYLLRTTTAGTGT
jgi:hypothetical protein